MKETNISTIIKFFIIRSGIVTLDIFTRIATLSFLQELIYCGRVIMHHQVSPYIIAIISITACVSCGAIGISSKLDFGDSESSKLVDTTNIFKPAPTPYKQYKKEEPTFTNIGVVCTGQGCNTTKPLNKTESTIETDVVVHVKTNINVQEKNKTNYLAETPDVPVIAGTNDRDNKPGGVLSTPYAPFVNSELYTKSLYVPTSQPQVELKVVPDARANNERFWYNANGIKIDIPRFEPTYQKHYYGENPPPPVMWYPSRSDFGYKGKSALKPSVWSYQTYSEPNHKHQEGGSGVTCTCKEATPPGLQWHPNRRAYGNDPGRQINDKLAPLN